MMLAICALLLSVGDLPATRYYPQLPDARTCAQRSWDAWMTAQFMEACAAVCGDNGDDVATMLRLTRADSWAWWNAKIMQEPATPDTERAAAELRLIEHIGAAGLYWGAMPLVAVPPEGWRRKLP